MVVNHGGGYQWRVCPRKDKDGKANEVNEACFTANPLAFANGKTTVVYSKGAGGRRISIDAVDVTNGVVPASGTLSSTVMANTAGQWHALIDCYGQHRRPVARFKWLLWPTPEHG